MKIFRYTHIFKGYEYMERKRISPLGRAIFMHWTLFQVHLDKVGEI